MNNLRKLIKEVLAKHTHDCGCGCHGKCGKAPMLNENLGAKITMTENMSYHVNNKKPLTENTFRYGSDAFLDLWAEARYLYSRDAIHLSGEDKKIITETNLGDYGLFEGQMVPLDLPMVEEDTIGESNMNEMSLNSYGIEEFLRNVKDHPEKIKKLGFSSYDELKTYIEDADYNEWDEIRNDFKKLNEASEYQGKKVQLNKPKRGGSKKFYVYVRDPKTKKVKKVSFGAAGGGQNLAVKIRDPKARRAFAKRQQCDKKKDRTKPGYWACNIGRYWKSLGGGSNFSGYW